MAPSLLPMILLGSACQVLGSRQKFELSPGGWMIIAPSPLLSKQHLVRHHQTRSCPRQLDHSDEASLLPIFERFCWWSFVPLCPLQNITWCYICSRSPRELGCSVPCTSFRVRRLLTTTLPPLGPAIYTAQQEGFQVSLQSAKPQR